jgi:hypothetical protein
MTMKIEVDASGRLAELELQRDAAMGATRALEGELERLRTNARRARHDLESHEEHRARAGRPARVVPLGADPATVPEPADPLASSRRRLEVIEQQIARVEARLVAARAKSTPANVLELACREFARRERLLLGDGRHTVRAELVEATAPPKSREPATALAAIREQIEELRAELEELRQRPLDLDGARARLEAWIAEHTADLAPLVASAMAAAPDSAHVSDPRLVVTDELTPQSSYLLGDRIVGVLLGVAGADRLRAAVLELLPDVTQGGIADDERRKQIARLEARLLGLEVLEERVIRSAERDAGAELGRRGDADPRAVLAADDWILDTKRKVA